MSELMNAQSIRANFRRQLLATVSAAALLVCVGAAEAYEGTDERPVAWIELGGQLERIDANEAPFSAPFLEATPTPPILGSINPSGIFSKRPNYGFGSEGAISFEPGTSGWIFSAAARVGRSGSHAQAYAKSQVIHPPKYLSGIGTNPQENGLVNFARISTKKSESHAIVDFQVGKDMGLGLFGNGSASQFKLGVRFAQFTSQASANVRARPDLHYTNAVAGSLPPPNYFPFFNYHDYLLSGHSERSFHGVGPSISWDASARVAGNSSAAEFTLDWGLNGSVLFGRQKARIQQQTSGQYLRQKYFPPSPPPSQTAHAYVSHYNHTPHWERSRAVIVPNLGGFAGVSARYTNAKLSLGYRADFFFGVMDGGINAARKENVGFYGPFATISIGIGG